ncbi:metallophosphoesterase family protein [Demequina iriomotensis]|uniref:metallophosphoesterase family protein n=1 Tax=Demequina iriomotensis TaxID=1536641 RepID=UPI000785E495|nr:metallophosphoesterase [Demequina iriomotensis]
MKIGILGDTHLNFNWIAYALGRFAERGLETIVQTGDLGVWPGERAARGWDAIDERLAAHGQRILAAPGNHEDYDQIDGLPVDDDGFLVFRDRIRLAPRGHRSALGDRSVVWLGGAASIDRAHRLEREASGIAPTKEWWAQEAVNAEDVARTVAGGHADIMVSHEGPHGVVALERRLEEKRPYSAVEDVMYSEHVKHVFTQAVHGVKPSLLLHGHYHAHLDAHLAYEDGRATRIVTLACDGQNGAMGALETETLAVEVWDEPVAWGEIKARLIAHDEWIR